MSEDAAADVQAAARAVLETADPAAKCAAARHAYALWTEGRLAPPTAGAPSCAPERPARPDRPELRPPGQVPRRRLGSLAGRVALLHAVAHIEFNAVDLAFDLVARFGGDPSVGEEARAAFIGDWLKVGDDEARHFMLVAGRLEALGAAYGDLPAHDGLWDAALASAHDLAARLASALATGLTAVAVARVAWRPRWPSGWRSPEFPARVCGPSSYWCWQSSSCHRC